MFVRLGATLKENARHEDELPRRNNIFAERAMGLCLNGWLTFLYSFTSGGRSIARLVFPHALGNGPPHMDLAFGLSDAEDEHVLGQPFLTLGQHRGDAQGEVFLPEQDVAAVAAAHRPDRVVLGEVQDQPAVDLELALLCRHLVNSPLGAERIHHLACPCGS